MIKSDSRYLNFKDTLGCGQTFRFKEKDGGYLVFSRDRCAFVINDGDDAIIDGDEYFKDYFDLEKDYGAVLKRLNGYGIEKLSSAISKHGGLRILKQDKFEAVTSFIVSQNNNIPRIKKTIENLCTALGEERDFNGERYYAFPTAKALADAPLALLKETGLGYRDEYVKGFAQKICDGDISLDHLSSFPTEKLRSALVSVKGIGNKVADCALLFGFNRFDAFPVDTWIEKLYVQDFNGTLTDRKKISEYFVQLFKEDSGYAQQFLFYAKRESEF